MSNPSQPPPAGVSDEAALVAAARDGDLNAFNTLVDLHQRAAFNLCLRMLDNWNAAEDATQDAFLSAFRAIRGFKGANFRPWLMRIAANACTDEIRRRARRPALSLDTPPPGADEPPDVADHVAGPEDAALLRERQHILHEALARLPHDQRVAVILCDLQGYSYEEIAETMRTSIGTVKSRIARGRERLRLDLAALGEQEHRRERP